MSLQGSFREIDSGEQIEGLFGDLWVIGLDRDAPPYGDGKAKILNHQGRSFAGGLGTPFSAKAVAGHLERGDRVFFYDTRKNEFVSDRFGLPTDPFHARIIREAIELFITK